MSILKKVQERRALTEAPEVITEGKLRLMATHKSDSGKHEAKVYKDSEWGEHHVKFHINGKHHEPSDYHTSDAEDAHATARHELKRLDKLNGALKEEVEETSELTEEQIVEMLDTLTIEEFEQLDEISKATLTSYVKKAGQSAVHHDDSAEFHRDLQAKFKQGKNVDAAKRSEEKHVAKSTKRLAGIVKAAKKLSEGSVDEAFNKGGRPKKKRDLQGNVEDE